MADEFAKGFGILVAAGLGWMTLAGWYRTPSFAEIQLVQPVTLENPTVYDTIGIFLMDGLFWAAILGPVVFWLLIPLAREARVALESRRSSD